MAIERKSLRVTDPKIAIDEMSTIDTRTKETPAPSGIENPENQAGGLFPLIEINKYKFTTDEIISMSIDETGFLPTCSVSVISHDGIFVSTSFPKDGDKLSVFIRSKKDKVKPLRADFIITSVSSGASSDNSGERTQFFIGGILSVPGLTGEHCKAFKDMTSIDCLTSVATELKLGFASNETSTADKQTWLCPFDTYEKFISDVTTAAYKDDNSFYRTWIDHNYYVNMLNVNTQFSDEFDIDKAFDELIAASDYMNDDKVEEVEMPLLLTNHKNVRGFGGYITGYTLINNSGTVAIDNGYRRSLQYYESHFNTDTPVDKYKKFFIEPMHTEGVKDKIILRGRAGDPESGKEQKYKWLGIQMSKPDGNAHEQYLYAQIQNWQNNEEIEKLMLLCVLPKCNFNIYRGQRIPVIILNDGNTQRQKMTSDPSVQTENEEVSYDRFLSGYYMVQGYRYSWNQNPGRFEQELYLTRREWPMPTFVPQDTKAGSKKNPTA